MGRSPCCAKEGLNRGAWTAIEDRIMIDYIKIHGEGNWRNLPKNAGLKRCGKSCRLRWLNYLKPDIKRGNITDDEEELIVRLHKLLGNRWSLIAGRLPGRTDNEIKNYWNTKIGKKLKTQERHKNSTPLAQAPEKPNLQALESTGQPSKMNGNASPIRTKASRCRKVEIPPELRGYNDQQHKPTTVAPAFLEGSSSHPKQDLSTDFTLDFQMDEELLSDLLNMDFPQLHGLDTEAAIDDSNTCTDHGFLSSSSTQTDMLSDDRIADSEFLSISAGHECEFDWIQD
ncbi:hypothetical protein K2173_024730 [Erythroxylum novogranatense]|uniref:Uncharacterized protein n=1 Tax=Erythroxylum novogranatense TaxID=1862640 RepID=A0AAV8SW95_9ROSI|nr:hypothetical protein K2173_024730 [Erythroxylum novogranatense]